MEGRSEITVTGVFDIETEKWDQFVAGGLLVDGKYREYTDEVALVDDLLSVDGVIWSHNGGRFDLLWLCDHIARRKLAARVGLAGSRIVSLKVGETTFRDSIALIPLALKDAAGIGDTEKMETGLVCDCGQECGGYCRIKRRGMPRAERKRLSEYLRHDCDALDKTLARLRGFAEEHDLDLCGTIGHSSWKTIQRWLGIPDAEWSSAQDYERCREGYFGGRVQIFRPSASKGWRYDINSAYPAALVETNIPHGIRKVLTQSEARKAYLSGKEGIYRVIVDVPSKMHIPCLPLRTKMRVVYPTGRFMASWTGIELREAERLGCEIVRILGATIWQESSPLLAAFCKKIWALRASLGKSHPIGKWLKWFANAPTGKLAQRPEHDKVKFISEHDDLPKLCPASWKCEGRCGWRCCKHLCTRKCGGWKPIRGLSVWRFTNYYIPTCGYVHWAAYLTAATRIKLGRQLRADDGGESAIYCDTDSVYSTTERHDNIGKNLGQFDLEGNFCEATGGIPGFQAIAPKVYRFWDPVKSKWHVRAKGIPEADKHWEDISGGQAVKITRGVYSFLQQVGDEKFFKQRDFSRKIHKNDLMFGDRKLGPDGRTYPLDAKEWLKNGT